MECSKTGCRRLVAVGCEDGAVRIFQLEQPTHEDDRVEHPPPHLQLVSAIPSVGAAILSMAWRRFPNPRHGKGCDGSSSTILFGGVADGTIRRYDCHEFASHNDNRRSGGDGVVGGDTPQQQWKSAHRMTVECYGRNIPTRVWKLLLLSDGTVGTCQVLGWPYLNSVARF